MMIYDITVAICEGVPIYEGDPKVSVEGVLSLAAGDPANVSRVSCGVHTGTHVDAPNHFIDIPSPAGVNAPVIDRPTVTSASSIFPVKS